MQIHAMDLFRKATVISVSVLTSALLIGCQTENNNQQPKNPQEVAPAASPLQSSGKILAGLPDGTDELATKPTEEVRALSATTAQDQEPNEKPDQATAYHSVPLRGENMYRGQLSQKGDIDYLSFQVAASGGVQFSMTLPQKMDYTFELQDASGNMMGKAIAANDLSYVLLAELQEGQTYLLKVHSPSGAFDASGNADYELFSMTR